MSAALLGVVAGGGHGVFDERTSGGDGQPHDRAGAGAEAGSRKPI